MAFIGTKEVKRFYGKGYLEELRIDPKKVALYCSALSDMCECINTVYAKELREIQKKREDASKST